MLNISSNKNKLILGIILIVVTLTVYWRVHGYDFINYDDPTYVTENSHVQAGLTLDGIRWSFSTKYLGFWNPLVWLSFMLDYQVYGLNAHGYHITNIILHILNTLLLFWLFCRMTGAVWKSAFVAAIFALHPLHVESVAWITERKDVLSAFFWMLTLCLYVYYTEKPVIKRYLLVLFSFILALMSKPMAVTLPAILILVDYWPIKRFESHKEHFFLWQLKEKAPFFVFSAVLVIITLYGSFNLEKSVFYVPFISRIANDPAAFVAYLEKTFWPYEMTVFYPFPDQILVWQVIAASIFIILITAIVLFMAKRFPYLLTGWFWFVISLLPVLGAIHESAYSMADRYHYLPSIGLSVMLAWGIPTLFKSEQRRNKMLLPIGVIILLTFSLLTWKQCGYWKNNVELWEHALKVTNDNYLAQNNLGLALFAEGKVDGALDHYSKAISIKPNDAVPYQNNATIYSKTGKYNLAIENCSIAIRLKPDNADAHNSRGNVYAKIGNYEQALQDFNEAIRLKPDYVDSYLNRASLYYKQGQYQEAVDDLNKAAPLSSANDLIYFNRGNFNIKLGRYQQALDDFSQSIRLKPDNYEAYNNRAFIYLMFGRYEQALEDYSKAIDLKPDYADAYNNRSFVYLNMGNMVYGCRDAKKACALGNCATLRITKVKKLCQ